MFDCGIHKDSYEYNHHCKWYQALGKPSMRNGVAKKYILVIEIFKVGDVHFMGSFLVSIGSLYILVGIDYISMWIKVISIKRVTARQ